MSKQWIEKTSKALKEKAATGGVELNTSFTKGRAASNRDCYNTATADQNCHDTKTQDENN